MSVEGCVGGGGGRVALGEAVDRAACTRTTGTRKVLRCTARPHGALIYRSVPAKRARARASIEASVRLRGRPRT